MTIPRKVTALFLKEITDRGLPRPKVSADRTLRITIKDKEFTVNLDNIAKEYARDRDTKLISRFADAVIASQKPIPPWGQAKAGIRFVAEPSDYEFGDALVDPITESLCRVLSYVNKDETVISWLTASHLDKWGRPKEVVMEAAARNMGVLLRKSPVEVETIDHFKLGMLATHSPLKASLIFSPNLKKIVSAKLGWPIYVVIPCRDFTYLFPDTGLIERLGGVVVREFSKSAYPISTEVFRVSDTGIEAIGRFPVE